MRITGHFALQTGANKWCLTHDQRNTLALHVRTHQRTVGVIVLQERNQSGGNRNELFRRYVHKMDLARFDFEEVTAVTHRNLLTGEMSASVDRGVGLGDEVIFFPI